MAGQADQAGDSPVYSGTTVVTAIGCTLAAYVFLGSPGLAQTPLAAVAPSVDPAQGWLPAAHFLFAAAMLTGGFWLSALLRTLNRPGAFPLVLFSVFQFGLLVVALTNSSLAIAAFRGGEALMGFAFAAIALVALRVHPELYMTILRHTSWVRSLRTSDLSPITGGGLIALTVASNLVPLALTFQSLTFHSGAMLATLFRRATIDPATYWPGFLGQTLAVSETEQTLAIAAVGASVALGLAWALMRMSAVRRLKLTHQAEQSLRPDQMRFIDDALPAAVAAVSARASSQRYVVWAIFWMVLVTPVLLATGYAAFMWFDLLQEQQALSWVAAPTSDFAPFASGEKGFAQFIIPAALVLIALTMSAPFAQSLYSGAKFDLFAFGQPMAELLRAKLAQAVAVGRLGPGLPFDADAFATSAARRIYWFRLPLVGLAVVAAAVAGFWEVGRGVAFTATGLIVQEHYFSPPKLVQYHEVQAVAVDCRIDALGARPVYELSLPGGRVVDMIGVAPLSERLDQYLAVDRRLQFGGVGYAYPPGDLEPCLKGIQQRYNSVIAAGTARLLHVLD